MEPDDVEAGGAPDDAQLVSGSSSSHLLQSVIKTHETFVISKSSCPYCISAVQQLEELGLIAKVYNVDAADKEEAATANGLRKASTALTKHATVPMIWISGTFIGGCVELKDQVATGTILKILDKTQLRDKTSMNDATNDEEHSATDRAVAIYPGPRSAFTNFFYFPEAADAVTVRAAGMISCIICVLLVIFGDGGNVIGWVALGLCMDFLLRLVGGSGCSPIGATAMLISCFYHGSKNEPRFMSAIPKQFAALCGTSMVAIGAGLYLGQYWLLGRIVLAMMAVLTGLEGFIGFCMGCVMFSAGIQLGVFPATVHRLFLQTHHEKKYTWQFMHTFTTERKAPPAITQRTPGLPANPTDVKSKFRLDSAKREWFNPIKYAAVTHFAAPVSIVSAALPWLYMGQGTVADVIAWFGFSLFVLLSLLYAAKAVLYPCKVLKEIQHPQKCAAFALIPITLLGCAASLRHFNDTWGDALFWAGAVLSCASSGLHLASLIAVPWSMDAVTPFWLVPPLSGAVTAVLAPQVTSSSLLEFGRYMAAYATVVYLALWPITLLRVVASFNNDFRTRYSISILACAPAALGLAYAALEESTAVFSYAFLASVGLSSACAAAVWPFNFFKEGKFEMSAWALAFPLNLVASAAVLYQSLVQSHASQFLVAAFTGAGAFTTVVLLLHTINGIVSGSVFVPITKWGPFSNWQMVHEAVRTEVRKLRALLADVGRVGSHSMDTYMEHLKRLNANIATHAMQEDTVIFPLLSLYFPGLQGKLSEEHEEHHAAYDAHMAQLQLLVSSTERSDESKEASAEAAQLLAGVKKGGNTFLGHLVEHLEHEEELFSSPIARKYVPVTAQKDLVRAAWDATPAAALTDHVQWVVSTLPMHPQKVRFVRALMWAMPERAQLIGLMVYRGVDDATWVKLANDIPDFVPRGLPGWRRYY